MTEKLKIVRMFPPQEQRVETGAIQFGTDWPGMFLRGDSAFALVMAIHGTMAGDKLQEAILTGWIGTLLECNLNDRLVKWAQQQPDPSPANQLRRKLHLAVTEELIRQKAIVDAKAYPDGYWLVDAIVEALRTSK